MRRRNQRLETGFASQKIALGSTWETARRNICVRARMSPAGSTPSWTVEEQDACCRPRSHRTAARLCLFRGQARPALGRQVAVQARGASDRGEYRQAGGAAAEHHKKAAEHLTHAAHHHMEAAKHHEAGHHEKVAHHAHTARAHVCMPNRQERLTLKNMMRNTGINNV
jgi:hypothetical protein